MTSNNTIFFYRGGRGKVRLLTIATLLGHRASLGQDLGQANGIAYLTNSQDGGVLKLMQCIVQVSTCT